jgi:flagellar basal-body rod modification protein FlgD
MALDLSSLTGTRTAAAAAAAAAAAGPGKKQGQLDQSDFLRLMTEQLKNQDPMKPLDPTQFLTQLTQFSVVDGVKSLQDGLNGLSDTLRSSAALDGASLVGHSVLAPGSTTTIAKGATVKGAFDVPQGATGLNVAITDRGGNVVRTIALEPGSGLTDFQWDGKTEAGDDAPAGAYTFKATASVGGKNTPLDTLLASRVDSVTIVAAGRSFLLNTALGSLQLADVRRVM